MKNTTLFFIFSLVLVGIELSYSAEATPKAFKLNGLFCDNMVLQRDQKVPVWGVGEPAANVAVIIKGQTKKAKIDKSGNWIVWLDPSKAGGPYTMTVKGPSDIVLKNVMYGDVWICSGQSNMQWSVKRSLNPEKEIAAANYPDIRLFGISRNTSDLPLKDVKSEWLICSPESIPNFSAVAYYFGRELHKVLKVPIGLINSSWGGTQAEPWTPCESMAENPKLAHIIKNYEKNVASNAAILKGLKDPDTIVKGKNNIFFYNDLNNNGIAKGWAELNFDDSEWKTMSLPGSWESKEKNMDIDGAVWFRKKISIPKEWDGENLILSMGAIDDFDISYFNSEKIGQTGKETKRFWTHPRVYEIPGKLVKAGDALVAIRVFDHFGDGGLKGPQEAMFITDEKKSKKISLTGDWKYKVETSFKPIKTVIPSRSPGRLFNAMISPLIPFGIKGAIWYQGESNAGRAYEYRYLLPAMIKGWRDKWGQGDFPFLIVQLANFRKAATEPVEDSTWAVLRESQLITSQLPSSGLAVITDIGDAEDIHPKNKQEVGRRLSLAARHIAHGDKLVFSGPIYKSMKIEGDKIRIILNNIGGGLLVKGGVLKHIAIAGDDQIFYAADALIDGDDLIVSSEKVVKPIAVRYAWSDNPEGCNFYNRDGLPASPFRTDSWTVRTQQKR